MSYARIQHALLVISIVTLVIYPAVSQEDKHAVEQDRGVHQWISQEGFRYFRSRVKGSELESYFGAYGVDGVFVDARQETVLDGVRDEDRPAKPPLFQGESDAYDLDASVNRHFCVSAKDIYTGLDFLMQYDSVLTQAENIWSANPGDNLVARYAAGDKAVAYYYLGHILHLVQDMTVPAHTHCDVHGSTFGSFFDSYEQGYCIGNFDKYRYEDEVDGVPILANRPVTIPEDLYTLFYVTAEYTDDYDSNDSDGEYASSGWDACFFPDDFPSLRLHRPQDTVRAGREVNDEACATIAKDLVYWAMRRTAVALRLFYRTVDTAGFSARVVLDTPCAELSALEDEPTEYTGPNRLRMAVKFDAEGRAYPVSGIVRDSLKVYYANRPEGGEWSGESILSVSTDEDSFEIAAMPGDYRFRAVAENGAGNFAEEMYGYLRVPGLRFVQVPKGGRVEATEPLVLEVTVAGAYGPITYQWEKDGVHIPGANGSVYTPGIPGAKDSGVYRCQVTDETKSILVTPPIHITVVAEGSLPAGGPASVLTAFTVIVLCARRRLRRP